MQTASFVVRLAMLAILLPLVKEIQPDSEIPLPDSETDRNAGEDNALVQVVDELDNGVPQPDESDDEYETKDEPEHEFPQPLQEFPQPHQEFPQPHQNPDDSADANDVSFTKSFYRKLDLVADAFWHDLAILHKNDVKALENFGRVFALLQRIYGARLATKTDEILFQAAARVLAGILTIEKALDGHMQQESDMQEMERLLAEMEEAGFLDGLGSLVWRLRQVQFYIRKTSGFLKALLGSDLKSPSEQDQDSQDDVSWPSVQNEVSQDNVSAPGQQNEVSQESVSSPSEQNQDSQESVSSPSEQNQDSQESVSSPSQQNQDSQESVTSPSQQNQDSQESVTSPSEQQNDVPQVPDQWEEVFSQKRLAVDEDDVKKSGRNSSLPKGQSNVSEEVSKGQSNVSEEATPKEKFKALQDTVTRLMSIVGELMLEIATPARKGQFLGDDVLDAGDRTADQLENLGTVAENGKTAILEMTGGNASDRLLTEVPKLASAMHSLIRRLRKKPGWMRGIIYVNISRQNVHLRTMRWVEENGGWVELDLSRNTASSTFFTADSVAIATGNAFGLDPPMANLVSAELFVALRNWDSVVPEDSRWTGWTDWSGCSVTCGSGGFRYKRRICLSMDGVLCEGTDSEESLCAANFSCELYIPVICPEDSEENVTEPMSTVALVPSTYRCSCETVPSICHSGAYCTEETEANGQGEMVKRVSCWCNFGYYGPHCEKAFLPFVLGFITALIVGTLFGALCCRILTIFRDREDRLQESVVYQGGPPPGYHLKAPANETDEWDSQETHGKPNQFIQQQQIDRELSLTFLRAPTPASSPTPPQNQVSQEYASSPSQKFHDSQDYAYSPSQQYQESQDYANSPSQEYQDSQDYVNSPSQEYQESQDYANSPSQQYQDSQDYAYSPSQQQDDITQAPDQSQDGFSQITLDVDEDEGDDVGRGQNYVLEEAETVIQEEYTNLKPTSEPEPEPEPDPEPEPEPQQQVPPQKTCLAERCDIVPNICSPRWLCDIPSPAYLGPSYCVNPCYSPRMLGIPSVEPCLSYMNTPLHPSLFGDMLYCSPRYGCPNMMNFESPMFIGPAAPMMCGPANCRFHPSPEVIPANMNCNQHGMAIPGPVPPIRSCFATFGVHSKIATVNLDFVPSLAQAGLSKTFDRISKIGDSCEPTCCVNRMDCCISSFRDSIPNMACGRQTGLLFNPIPMKRLVEERVSNGELGPIFSLRKSNSMAVMSGRVEAMFTEEEREVLSERVDGAGCRVSSLRSCFAGGGSNPLLNSSVNRFDGSAGCSSNLFSATAAQTQFNYFGKCTPDSVEQQEVLSEIVKSGGKKMAMELPVMQRVCRIIQTNNSSCMDDNQVDPNELYFDEGVCKRRPSTIERRNELLSCSSTNEMPCFQSPRENRKPPSFGKLPQAPEPTKSATEYRSFTSLQSPSPKQSSLFQREPLSSDDQATKPFHTADLDRAITNFVDNIGKGADMLSQRLNDMKSPDKDVEKSQEIVEEDSSKPNWMTRLKGFFGIKTNATAEVQTEGNAMAQPSVEPVAMTPGRRLNRFSAINVGPNYTSREPFPKSLAQRTEIKVKAEPSSELMALTPSASTSQEFTVINEGPNYKGNSGGAPKKQGDKIFGQPFPRSLADKTEVNAKAGPSSESSESSVALSPIRTSSQELTILYEGPEQNSKPKKKKEKKSVSKTSLSAEWKPSKRTRKQIESDMLNSLKKQDKKSEKKETSSKKSDKKKDSKDEKKKKKKKGGPSLYSFRGEESMETQSEYSDYTSEEERIVQVVDPPTSTGYSVQTGGTAGTSPCYSVQTGRTAGTLPCYSVQTGRTAATLPCYSVQTGRTAGTCFQNAYSTSKDRRSMPVSFPGCPSRFSVKPCERTGTRFHSLKDRRCMAVGAPGSSPYFSVTSGETTANLSQTADNSSKEKRVSKSQLDLRSVSSTSSMVSSVSQDSENMSVAESQMSVAASQMSVAASQMSISAKNVQIPLPTVLITRPSRPSGVKMPYESAKAKISAEPIYQKSTQGSSSPRDRSKRFSSATSNRKKESPGSRGATSHKKKEIPGSTGTTSHKKKEIPGSPGTTSHKKKEIPGSPGTTSHKKKESPESHTRRKSPSDKKKEIPGPNTPPKSDSRKSAERGSTGISRNSRTSGDTLEGRRNTSFNSSALSGFPETPLLRGTDSDASSQSSDLQVAAIDEEELSNKSDAASPRTLVRSSIDRDQKSIKSKTPMQVNLGNTNSTTKSRFTSASSCNEVRFAFPRFARSDASPSPTLNASQHRGVSMRSFQPTWRINRSSVERKIPGFASFSKAHPL